MEQPPEREGLPWERGPRLLTPSTGGLGMLTTYLFSAYLAYRSLGHFPPARALWILASLIPHALAGGILVGRLERADLRGRAFAVVISMVAVAPFALVAWVPGIAQAQQHPLPGEIDVVIAAAPDGNLDLYLIPGGDPDRAIELTRTADAAERFPKLSPDGKSVVYAVDAIDGSTDLYLMTLDERGRSERSRLLLDGPGDLSETSWSPDGRQLLVRSDTEERADLYRYVFATGKLRLFERDAANPAWSPDGATVAFAGFSPSDPADSDIFVVDSRGRGRRAVVDTGHDDFFPIWAPDGRRIAFASRVLDQDLDVLVVGLDGSRLRFLTTDRPGDDEPYLWGPRDDIVFLSDRPDVGGVFAYLMKPDGTDVRLFLRL